jgi:hypothetical protein
VKKSPNQERTSNFVEKISLVKLRLKAMRTGVWYRALNRIDRVLVDLTIKVAKTTIKSNSLINQLLSVTTKIETLLENKLSRETRLYGLPQASKLGSIAQSWGNKNAHSWSSDNAFAKFLAALNLNVNHSL